MGECTKANLKSISLVKGVKLASTSAGIYKTKRPDLVLLELSKNTVCSAVFTQNNFSAAPVQISREHMESASGRIRYCIINAGNANAGTGNKGYQDAKDICNELAKLTRVQITEILPFSTGVIGEYLPVNKIINALPELVEKFAVDKWQECAKAIMTTDTVPKLVSKELLYEGKSIRVSGIAKGAGMIMPNMATMLAFITTDAKISKELLDSIFINAVNKSFNRITVDGDTSTNDSCFIAATGQTDISEITKYNEMLYHQFSHAIEQVCMELAHAIVRDGEGSTKFIKIEIEGGITSNECLQVGYSVANSPLVKTALYASDPNWGRILAAIGRSGLKDLDISLIDVKLNSYCIVHRGYRSSEYNENKAKEIMESRDIVIGIHLSRGSSKETIWTCDLSHDYITINADYRS